MVFASGVRRLRVLGVAFVGLFVLAVAAQPAQAEPRVINGGETRLEVSVGSFVLLLQDGIWINPIAPARLEFGGSPAAIFPVNSALGGAADADLQTATAPHEGGLRIEKASIGQTIDATNVTLSCLPVAGCRLLNTANNLLPNELAEVRDFTFTDNGTGTVTVSGFAYITALTALTLNTLFQTDVFFDGMQLGASVSTLNYDTGYPRPKGASPMQVSLVPAYQQCTAANRQHGAPLASPSCSPPTAASSWVTVGTPDANQRVANSNGSLRLVTEVGSPSTPGDQADVRLVASITDVRNKSDLTDYAGELQARLDLRLTDDNNGPALVEAATAETTFTLTIPCAATGDTDIGSTCSASTTADAVLPGAVPEGKRSVWELGKVQVFDGGSDGVGSTSPNTLFAAQGVFVP